MFTDPIADMLTRIRNASAARKADVVIPFSKMKWEIANIMAKEGFIRSAEKILEGRGGVKVQLKYQNTLPRIDGINRISKPGRRIYINNEEIRKVRNGLGIAILSTSKGLFTDKQAREMKIGGELICEIY